MVPERGGAVARPGAAHPGAAGRGGPEPCLRARHTEHPRARHVPRDHRRATQTFRVLRRLAR